MAARYWVGGSATWDGTAGTKWAATSGGAGGQAVPTSSDDVFLDAASGAVTVTVGAAGVACRSFDCTGFTGTLAGSGGLPISGSMALFAGMTRTYTGRFTFNSTTTGNTIATAGKTLASEIRFDGVGGGWTLADAMTTTVDCALTNGALSLGSSKLTSPVFSSINSNIRTLDFGTGDITVTGNNTTVFSLSTDTNLTTAGSRVVNMTYSGATGTRTVSAGSTLSEANAINFNVTAGTDSVNFTTSNYKSINFTGFAGTLLNRARSVFGNLTVSTGMTLEAGTLATTFAATSGTKTITTNGKTVDFPLTFNGIGGTFAFADALTQGSSRAFTITNGTVKLKNGVTSTVGAFATSGSNAKTLQSTVDGSQATLSQASGTVTVTNLTIKDIAATGGATFNAYLSSGNVNAGNNSGWSFLYPAQLAANSGLSMRLGLSL